MLSVILHNKEKSLYNGLFPPYRDTFSAISDRYAVYFIKLTGDICEKAISAAFGSGDLLKALGDLLIHHAAGVSIVHMPGSTPEYGTHSPYIRLLTDRGNIKPYRVHILIFGRAAVLAYYNGDTIIDKAGFDKLHAFSKLLHILFRAP